MQGERAILLDHRYSQVPVPRNHAAGAVEVWDDPAESTPQARTCTRFVL
ncbi:hypothetical protein [Arthrobacter methylotrophus]